MRVILYFKITVMENMNVYLYGGKGRDDATISIVPDNVMPELNKIYELDATNGDGFLLIAYPNKDSETKFEFQYWEELIEYDEMAGGGGLFDQDDDLVVMLLVVILAAVLSILCICLTIVFLIRKHRAMINKIEIEIVDGGKTGRQMLEGEGGALSPEILSPEIQSERNSPVQSLGPENQPQPTFADAGNNNGQIQLVEGG